MRTSPCPKAKIRTISFDTDFENTVSVLVSNCVCLQSYAPVYNTLKTVSFISFHCSELTDTWPGYSEPSEANCVIENRVLCESVLSITDTDQEVMLLN